MIEIGQDATGQWAFLIRDAAGQVTASDDDFESAERALSFANRKARRMEEKKQ